MYIFINTKEGPPFGFSAAQTHQLSPTHVHSIVSAFCLALFSRFIVCLSGSIYLSIHLSVCTSIYTYLSIHLSTYEYRSFYLSVFLSTHLTICFPVCWYACLVVSIVYLSSCACLFESVYLSVCLSIYLSIYRCVCLIGLLFSYLSA